MQRHQRVYPIHMCLGFNTSFQIVNCSVFNSVHRVASFEAHCGRAADSRIHKIDVHCMSCSAEFVCVNVACI